MKKIILFLFISMAFCSEEKNFTFKYKYYEGQKVKYNKETIIILEIPVIGEFRMGENYSVIDEYLGEKDGFYILQKTIFMNLVLWPKSVDMTVVVALFYEKSLRKFFLNI